MNAVKVVEVGLRDGLQNEAQIVPLSVRQTLLTQLLATGLKHIEVGACVSPRWVPQMADSANLLSGVVPPENGSLSLLVPNEKGLSTALAAGAKDIAVFTAASETFTQKNINMSIAQSLERFRVVIDEAKKHQVRVRGYVSCVVACPYEGLIDPAKVAEVSAALWEMGCDEVSLGDTIGVANPKQIQTLLAECQKSLPMSVLAGHFHDTYGMAIANTLAALEMGLRTFDGSVSGLGGCPYAPGASGNAATEDLVYLCEGMGLATGVDLDLLAEAGAFIRGHLGTETRSRVAQAILA